MSLKNQLFGLKIKLLLLLEGDIELVLQTFHRKQLFYGQ